MGCKGCGGTTGAMMEVTRSFGAELDGVRFEITVRGDVTARNRPLVQQYLVAVYELLKPSEERHDKAP